MDNDVIPALENTEAATKGVSDVIGGSMMAAIQQFKTAAESMAAPAEDAAESIKEEFANPSTGVAAVIENSFKRLDDTFQNVSEWLRVAKIKPSMAPIVYVFFSPSVNVSQ